MAALNSSLDLVAKYADGFRELVNARVWAKNESPSKALRLNSEEDWNFICVAMDVIGDAALAIENFLRFGLDGPTRYDSVGEQYLRLYGLLSATYLQQEAVLKLYQLMNCHKPDDVKTQLCALEIRTLRHQVASHSVDYRQPGGGKNLAFVPVRIGLQRFTCEVTENRGDTTRTVRLDVAVDEHCKLIVAVLDAIYEKSIKTLFKGRAKRIAEFTTRLDDLRFIRAGNLLIRGGDPTNPTELRVVFVSLGDVERNDA